MLLSALLTLAAASPAENAVREAIQDEIEFGIEATRDQNIERYMETVPADYRIVEDDGTITDRDTLRANQLRAWSIITRTNDLRIEIESLELGCDGNCATVRTHQRWDRQMTGRDGKSEHNVVTTQKHVEAWEQRNGRWLNTKITELGGTVAVDGKPF